MNTPTAHPPRDQREKLALTRGQACDLMDGDDPAYKVVSDKIIDHGRWAVVHWLIIQRVSDGRFFSDSYGVGATESQEEGPWEYSEPDFREVFPQEKVTIDYV